MSFGDRKDGLFNTAGFQNAYQARLQNVAWSVDADAWLDAAEFVERDGKSHWRLVETPPRAGTIWRRVGVPENSHMAVVKVVRVSRDGYVQLERSPRVAGQPLYSHYGQWQDFVVAYDPWIPTLWERLAV